MPAGNPLGYLPPEMQAQLLGMAGPLPMSGAAMLARGMQIGGGLGQMPESNVYGAAPATAFNSDPAESSMYGESVRRAMMPPLPSPTPRGSVPAQGTMEYLDYIQDHPMPTRDQPGQPQQNNQSGMRNLMEIFMGSSPVQQPGMGQQPQGGR